MRGFVGVLSGRVLVASIYLHDLGPLIAIPGRPLITTETLRAELDKAIERGHRVDRAARCAPRRAAATC